MTKVEQILEASTRLFIEQGFHATPTSKIASEARVSNGTLFHYFNTKEKLISELYLSIKKEVRSVLIEEFKQQKDTKQKIKHVWINWVNWGMKNEYKFRFLEAFSNSPYIESVSKEEASKSFEFTMEIIKTGIEEEVLIDIDPQLMSMLIYSSVNSIVKFSYIKSNEIDSNYLDKIFDMVWKSIVNI